jgi:hypothetical protein
MSGDRIISRRAHGLAVASCVFGCVGVAARQLFMHAGDDSGLLAVAAEVSE